MAERFTVDGPVAAVVRMPNGRVEVARSADGTATASVEPLAPDDAASAQLAAGSVIRLKGDTLEVTVPEARRTQRGGSVLVTLGLPASSRLRATAGALTLSVRDGLDHLDARIGSGSVDVDRTERALVVRAGQVDVSVEHAGSLSVTTGQGALRAGSVGDAAFRAAQGEVELGRTHGAVAVAGAAVSLVVRAAGPGSIRFQAAAGGAEIGVVAGTTVQLDLSSGTGDVRCDLPPDDGSGDGADRLRLRLRSATGDLLVTPAPVDPPADR